MTWRVSSGWMFIPSRRTKNLPTNTFMVGIEGIENEDELPERVRRKLKRAVKDSERRRYNLF